MFKVSERRACQLLDFSRTSHRYHAKRPVLDKPLVERIHKLALQHPRYGYRRIHALLVREGWRINRKRVARLWKQEGLQVIQKPKRVKVVGESDNACYRKIATQPNEVWSYDFLFDSAGSSTMKILAVVDEYTRECLALKAGRQMKATDVVEQMNLLFQHYGQPQYIRSDNGPEYTAQVLTESFQTLGIDTLHIAPGSPWENGYCESFIGKLRDELLSRELFYSLKEAQVMLENFRQEYNTVRPHSSLDYLTPHEFKAYCLVRAG